MHVAILFLVSCLLWTPSSFAQAVIQGRILGHDGSILPRADVQIYGSITGSSPEILSRHRTDTSGRFSFKVMPRGLLNVGFSR